MKKYFKAFSIAVTTLTIIPFPYRSVKAEQQHFRLSLFFFPSIGLFLALILGIVYQGWLLTTNVPAEVCALLLVLVSIASTGALHIDGLADVCDGFGGGRTREKILEIFKDSRHGTFGVTAIVLDLLVKFSLYKILIDRGDFVAIAISLILSRTLQSLTLVFMPYVGLTKGVAGIFTGTTYGLRISLCCFIMLVALGSIGFPNRAIACGASILCCVIFLLVCKKKIGGITGDCIGTVNEIAEVTFLVSALFAA